MTVIKGRRSFSNSLVEQAQDERKQPGVMKIRTYQGPFPIPPDSRKPPKPQ